MQSDYFIGGAKCMAKSEIEKIREKIAVAMKLPSKMQREQVLTNIIHKNYGLLNFEEVKEIIKSQNPDMTEAEVEKRIEAIVCNQ